MENTETKKDLTYFINWWDNRRIHWSRAFKCDLYAPRANQAKAVNAAFQHRRSVKISLLKAAQEDTSESIIVESSWKAMTNGVSNGSGPSGQVINEKQLTRQKQMATRMAAEFNFMDQSLVSNQPMTMFIPDPKSRHRPNNTKVGQRKKESVHMTTQVKKKLQLM